jgi:hypothetical protein
MRRVRLDFRKVDSGFGTIRNGWDLRKQRVVLVIQSTGRQVV